MKAALSTVDTLVPVQFAHWTFKLFEVVAIHTLPIEDAPNWVAVIDGAVIVDDHGSAVSGIVLNQSS